MWKTSMGIHDRKSQISDRIVPRSLSPYVRNWKDRHSRKLRHYRLHFLPTRDSYVGPGRGHQQWSSPRKQAEYNLKYLIIAFCILILLVKLWTSIVIAAGIKKVQGTFILQAPHEIINIFWPGISFTCSLSGCLYTGGHGCWSRDLKENKILLPLIVPVLSRMMISMKVQPYLSVAMLKVSC